MFILSESPYYLHYYYSPRHALQVVLRRFVLSLLSPLLLLLCCYNCRTWLWLIRLTRFLIWQDANGSKTEDDDVGKFAAVAPLTSLLHPSANLVDAVHPLTAAVIAGGAESIAIAADSHLCHVAQCLVTAALVVVLGIDAATFPRSLFRYYFRFRSHICFVCLHIAAENSLKATL